MLTREDLVKTRDALSVIIDSDADVTELVECFRLRRMVLEEIVVGITAYAEILLEGRANANI